MTTRSLAASLPLGALGTLAMLGVASFVAIAAVIHEPIGAHGGVVSASGASVLTISSDRPRSLSAADVDAIVRQAPAVSGLSRIVVGTVAVTVGNQVTQLPIHGVDPSYPQVTSGSVGPGVFFGLTDANAANPVAVLGHDLAVRLFAGVSPVGQTIRLRNVPYTVIGVLASQASPPAESADNAVLIPFRTGQVRLFGPGALDHVVLQVRDATQMNVVRVQVEQLLRQRHQVRAGQPDGFTIGTSTEASSGDTTETAIQFLGHLLQQYRQYMCEAKGLCARAA